MNHQPLSGNAVFSTPALQGGATDAEGQWPETIERSVAEPKARLPKAKPEGHITGGEWRDWTGKAAAPLLPENWAPWEANLPSGALLEALPGGRLPWEFR